jgi:ssDNA-binding replication factor A large subunit
MPTTYKVLGQSAPANTNNADLYTVPSSTSAVVSTLLVTNVTATDATCRIFVRVAGANATVANAVVYDGTVKANDFTAITVGITLGAGDIISVRSSSENALTFQAFGSEIS